LIAVVEVSYLRTCVAYLNGGENDIEVVILEAFCGVSDLLIRVQSILMSVRNTVIGKQIPLWGKIDISASSPLLSGNQDITE
jgi:hypothetical protein